MSLAVAARRVGPQIRPSVPNPEASRGDEQNAAEHERAGRPAKVTGHGANLRIEPLLRRGSYTKTAPAVGVRLVYVTCSPSGPTRTSVTPRWSNRMRLGVDPSSGTRRSPS